MGLEKSIEGKDARRIRYFREVKYDIIPELKSNISKYTKERKSDEPDRSEVNQLADAIKKNQIRLKKLMGWFHEHYGKEIDDRIRIRPEYKRRYAKI